MAVNLNRLYHVNINVSDLERSIAFYEKLGFKVTARFRMDGDLGERTAKAFGATFNPIEAAFLRLGDQPGSMLIDLCQYIDPPTHGTPVRQLDHAGMVRLAFHVDNIEDAYQGIADMGIETLGPLQFMTPPGGTRSGVFAFYDPDGTILEVLTGVEHMAG
ncbi:VOC family protein [Sphingobium sp. Sx8-8]|uniref:VOC family protein n=1 Tax=Sphingobium sp. Sx8-8 TaxID=2933617 RepID=UPI001F594E51|nr:VOC family protein [Sphingobium sp. Sx8-8]